MTERFADGGRVQHAMLVAGPARFAVKDAGDGDPAPSGGGVPVIMALYVRTPTRWRRAWWTAAPR